MHFHCMITHVLCHTVFVPNVIKPPEYALFPFSSKQAATHLSNKSTKIECVKINLRIGGVGQGSTAGLQHFPQHLEQTLSSKFNSKLFFFFFLAQLSSSAASPVPKTTGNYSTTAKMSSCKGLANFQKPFINGQRIVKTSIKKQLNTRHFNRSETISCLYQILRTGKALTKLCWILRIENIRHSSRLIQPEKAAASWPK